MSLTTGSRVGPYEITGRVGAGGMGEVLRGRDTRIGRDVAIKVLPEDVAVDAERLRRFEQEARAAGTLNHPNLVTVHDVGTHDGVPYLVMELLEGETLRAKLGENGRPSRIPIRKAMDYAQQLAVGLAAAHEKGIVHRDLKPDNVFVTKDGRLKLLDFGLAKVQEPETSTEDATRARHTTPGTIIGTVGYMAPEQVRGQETDQRADIFAAGAILYEMISGQRAFHRGSSADTMSAILNEDPPDLNVSSGQHVSPGIDRVIRRCLEKERTERFESARDLAFALEAVSSSSATQEVPALEASPRSRSRVAWLAVALLIVAALAAWAAYRLGRASVQQPRATYTQLTSDAGIEYAPAIAPDGKTFVFVKGEGPHRQLFLQRIDGRSAIALSRSHDDDDRAPAFSPDGSQIAFRSSRDGGGIFVMGATGESARRITPVGFDPAWSPDGKEIVFSSEEMVSPASRNSAAHLSIVNVATGAVRVLTRHDGMQPSFSPNGKRVLFWALKGRSGQRDLYTIAVSGDEKSLAPLLDDAHLDWNGVWAPDGKSVFFASDRGGTMNIWRMGVEEESGRPSGEPRPLAVPAMWAGDVSISGDGHHLVYASRTLMQEMRKGALDRAMQRVVLDEKPVLAGSTLVRTHELSPDGRWIAFSTEGKQEDVFVMRVDGSETRQLTNDEHRDRGVTWMPDSERIVFYSARTSTYDAWSIRIDGSGLTQLTQGLKVNFPTPSPDGRKVAIFDFDRAAIADITAVPATTARSLPPLPDGKDIFFPSGWSPDGTRIAGTEWLARKHLYVYSFTDGKYQVIDTEQLPPADNRLQLMNTGGVRGVAKWIDNQRLLAVSGTGTLLVIDLARKTTRVVGSVDAASLATGGKAILATKRDAQIDVWLARTEQ